MALTAQEVYNRELIIHLNAPTSFRQIVKDVSAQLGQDGGALVNTRVTRDTALVDYSDTKDLVYGDVTDAQVKLSPNIQKAFAFIVYDTQMAKTTVPIFLAKAQEAAQDFRIAIATGIMNAYSNAFPAAQNTDLALKTSTASSGAKWGTAAAREAMMNAYLDTVVLMEKAGFPAGQMFCVMAPETRGEFVKYLVIDKPNLGTGVYVDSALTGFGLPTIAGVRILTDSSVTVDGTKAGSTELNFGIVGESIYYVQQINRVDVLRSHDNYGDLWRQLVTFGALRVADDLVRRVSINFTA